MMGGQNRLPGADHRALLVALLLGLLPQVAQAANCTYREDYLGQFRASDGTLCRIDSLGRLKCRGESTPPKVLGNK